MKKSDELFKVMGINRTSDKEAIKKAYKSRAKELHPDKGGNESDFKELNFAYSILINPEKLENFDSGINQKDHDSEKMSAMAELFQLAIDQSKQNILNFVKHHLIERNKELDARIKKAKSKKSEFEKIKDKISHKNEEINMFRSVIMNNIEKCDHVLITLEKSKELFSEIMNEIEDYSEKDIFDPNAGMRMSAIEQALLNQTMNFRMDYGF